MFLTGGNNNCCAIYFTQSQELLKKVKKQYDGIALNSTNNDIEFSNINDFCVDQLGLDYSSVVLTRDFISFLHSSNNKHSDRIKQIRSKHPEIDDMMIWTEIRGVLKGSMGSGNKWEHTAPLDQTLFSSFIEYLFSEKYIERVEINNSKKYFCLRDSVERTRERAKQDFVLNTEKDGQIKKALIDIIDYFSTFDSSLRIMSKDEYLTISNKISILSEEQKTIVYEIAQIYDAYLLENDLYDENDLIRAMFANEKEYFPNYDFVVVDETQDYTELQLYFVQKICADRHNIVYAGDIHQIINPTIFDIPRLKSLYLDEENKSHLNIYFLRKNFRCQQGVVDVANRVSDLRREIIGRKTAEVEYTETAVSSTYSQPYRLSYTQENICEIVSELIKYPNVAILVSSDQEKARLKEAIAAYDDIGQDVELLKVFTIAEIKGMEYSYIVCYNMVSAFGSVIAGFFENNKTIKSKETKNRFCFNSIYVATTRAQDHLCFIDEDIVSEFDARLQLQKVIKFEADNLYFDTLSDSLEDWYKEAIKLKENGKYYEAIKYFRRSGPFASATDFYECKAELAAMDRNYDRAIIYYVLSEDNANVKKYMRDQSLSSEAKRYLEFINGGGSVDGITKLLKLLAMKVDVEDQEAFYATALDNIDAILWQSYDSLIVPEV